MNPVHRLPRFTRFCPRSTFTSSAATTATIMRCHDQRRLLGGWARSTQSLNLPMKAGTDLSHFAVFKNQDPPKVLERSEYPEWVNDLEKPLISLAALRRIPNEEAQDVEIMRYLKLTRRMKIRQRNEESAT